MSIQKIEQLREERKRFMEKYQKELESVKKDDRISESYREQKIEEITANLNDVKHGHDQKIKELIQTGKNESLTKAEKAEFEALNEKELLTKLILENRNRDKAAALEKRYADDVDSLLSEARKALAKNAPDVPAYAQALRNLSQGDPMRHIDIDRIEQTYKTNNLNPLQKDYYRDYEAYAAQEQAYNQETERERFMDALNLNR